MTAPIVFFVEGDPQPQPRPRAFARKFGSQYQARVYDPGTAEGWKNQIAVAAKPFIPFKIPLFSADCAGIEVLLHFIFQRPKGHFRSNGALHGWAPAFHTSRKDCDNLAKAVLDALTTLGFWADDGIVCRLSIEKRWAAIGERTGCHVDIRKVTSADRNAYDKGQQETLELK